MILPSMPTGPAGREVADLHAQVARLTKERDAARVSLRLALGKLRDIGRATGDLVEVMERCEEAL